MTRYQTSTPRTALLLTAIGLSALTLAFSVVLPAAMDSAETQAGVPASVTADGRVPAEAALGPGRIEVVVLRDAESAPGRIGQGSPRMQSAEVRDLGFISVQACSTMAKRKHRAGSA